MGAVWYRARAELRSGWRASLGLALLVGLAGGAALATAAGARRNDSALDRFLTKARASHVDVNPGNGIGTSLRAADVAALPGVAAVEDFRGMLVLDSGPDGGPLFDEDQCLTAVASFSPRDQPAVSRPVLAEGRRPDPARADEVLVNPLFAERRHVSVGDEVGFWASDDYPALVAAFSSPPAPGQTLPGFARRSFTITGIGRSAFDVLDDEVERCEVMTLTPAYARAHRKGASYLSFAARLEHDGEVERAVFQEGVEALAPDEPIDFSVGEDVARRVERAIGPQTVALALFAAVVGLTGLLVAGQALHRQQALAGAEHPVLSGLGLSRAQLVGTGLLRTGAVAVTGALVAAALAVALSASFPLGVARRVEADPGPSLDGPVLLLGVGAVVLALVALGAVSAWRLARSGPARLAGANAVGARGSRLARRLARAGAPPTLVNGVRLALEPGRGRRAVPTRATLAGAAVAVGAGAGAVVFSASLGRLVSTPRLYGETWDLQITIFGDPDTLRGTEEREVRDLLEDDPDLGRWSLAIDGQVVLDGRRVPALGAKAVTGLVIPPLVEGRYPTGDDEVALGGRTLDRLDVAVGDTVDASSEEVTGPLTVVGQVVLPATEVAEDADLSHGALLTFSRMDDLTRDSAQRLHWVALRDGTDADAVAARLDDALDERFGIEPHGDRPGAIVNLDRIRSTPAALAGVLALLAAATVTHALVTATRRRRAELALLKTLGFARRQVAATVAWQASTIAVVAVAVGLPTGVALGRWAWTLVAESLGTIAAPVAPVRSLALIGVAALAVANLAAWLPGRAAARTRPAVALRAE